MRALQRTSVAAEPFSACSVVVARAGIACGSAGSGMTSSVNRTRFGGCCGSVIGARGSGRSAMW